MDGNDPRYDEILKAEWARGNDAEIMQDGCHYDYVAQTWRDGHDHAHCASCDDDLPLLFCGADAVTCAKGHPELWAVA